MRTPASADLGFCRLQRNIGIDEKCCEDCLFYELANGVGCLLRNADSMPRGIGRSLLRKAGRRFR